MSCRWSTCSLVSWIHWPGVAPIVLGGSGADDFPRDVLALYGISIVSLRFSELCGIIVCYLWRDRPGLLQGNSENCTFRTIDI